MSHIAVDLKVIEVHAPGVARCAGVSEDRILAGLVRLWHRCWSTKTDLISRVALSASMGGERIDDIAAAMVDSGLLEPVADGWRVRGADRYLRLTEARKRGGKAAAKHLVPGARFSASAQSQPRASPEPAEKVSGLVSALTPSTEHRAPNTLKAAAGSAPLTTAIGWWVEAQRRREAAGLQRETPPGPGKLDHWFAVAMLEADEQKLLAGYDAFLVDPFWRNEADKRCAWSGWLNQWRDFVTRATAPPVPGRRDARAPAQPSMNFTNSVTEGF
jgi:hypothetical protein